MEPGIYFGLPEAEYHGAFALSASGIKWLNVSTLDFWVRSPLNPALADVQKEEGESEAKSFGHAYHKRILEGREAFDSCYAPSIDKTDYHGVLDTNDELQSYIRSHNEGLDKCDRVKLTGRKDELIERVLSINPSARIWDAICDEYRQRFPGKVFLDAEQIKRIEIMARMIEAKEDIAGTFTNGMPEASVFYVCRDTGVPCKLRTDYLRPDYIGELKGFANKQHRAVDDAINREFSYNRYAIQAAWYIDAMPYVRALLKAGRVFGDVDRSFVEALRTHQPKKIEYVWVQKGVAPVARGKTFQPMSGSTEMGTYAIAKARNDGARVKLRQCLDTYPPDVPWVDRVPKSLFLDEEIPGDPVG